MPVTCSRHEHCAYTGAEPDRCPSCHTTWAAVEACKCEHCGTRERHRAWHATEDARRARDAARRRQRAGRGPIAAEGG